MENSADTAKQFFANRDKAQAEIWHTLFPYLPATPENLAQIQPRRTATKRYKPNEEIPPILEFDITPNRPLVLNVLRLWRLAKYHLYFTNIQNIAINTMHLDFGNDIQDERYERKTLGKFTFRGCTFTEIHTMGLCDFEELHFYDCVFKGKVDFADCHFQKLEFQNCVFESSVSLDRASFINKAFFTHSTFKDSTSFRHSQYTQGANFGESIFMQKADFSQIRFRDFANFTHTIFNDYADGRPMQDIANELNEAGIRTVLGRKFTVNSLRHILHNRAYIGEYRYSDVIVPDGMPRLISDDLFQRVQARFIQNKRTPRPQQNTADDSPRYWLTGKLFCGLCGEPLHGMSGTGKSGKRWYYYACNGKTRRKGCKLPNVKQDIIEAHVVWILRQLLDDTANLACISADIAHAYQSRDDSGAYLDSLRQQLKDAEKGITNLIRAMEAGAISETLTARLNALETQKTALTEQIEAETIKQELTGDKHTIEAFFKKFSQARLEINDIETAEQILEYFVNKIYVYPDPLRIVFEFAYDCDPLGVSSEMELDDLSEITEQAFDIDDSNSRIYNKLEREKQEECPPAGADGGLLRDTKGVESPEMQENPATAKGSPPPYSAP